MEFPSVMVMTGMKTRLASGGSGSDSIDDGLGLLGPNQVKSGSMISWTVNVSVLHSYTLNQLLLKGET